MIKILTNNFHQPRRFFVGGNWKMNGTKAEIDTIVSWMSKYDTKEQHKQKNADIRV